MTTPLATLQTYELPEFRGIGKDVIFVENHQNEIFCDPHIFEFDYSGVVDKAIEGKEPAMVQGNRNLYFRLDWLKALDMPKEWQQMLPFLDMLLGEILKHPSKKIEVVLIDEITGYGHCYAK